ncbi:phage/plasmid primase, P4 family [Roseateles puraquae]|uniref:phage/plasmid primase, P4 family n=1 Tax=Roseateles puraquae TaxID=431059 RepID=UPI0031D0EE69
MKSNHLKNATLQQALDVCRAIHGHYSFVIQLLRWNSTSKHLEPVKQIYTDTADLAHRIDDLYGQGLTAMLLVAPADQCSTKIEDVRATWALACDLDEGALPILRNPLLEPSIIIQTSPGRFHVVWLLKEALEPERAGALLRAMARRLNADPAFARTNQLIRLPGFVNGKHGNETELLAASNLSKTFDVDVLIKGFDLELIDGIHQRLPSMRRESPSRDSPEMKEQIEDVRSALPYLQAHADDYQRWVRVLRALVPLGEPGRSLAREFSAQSKKFSEVEFDKKWKQLERAPGHVAAIFALAMDSGWSNPGYRRTDRSAAHPMTDREFGAEVAHEMSETHAAIGHLDKGRRLAHFMVWDRETYKPLNTIETRRAIGDHGERVIARLLEAGSISGETAKQFKMKLGKNNLLDEVTDHVAEWLQTKSELRLLSRGPYLGVQNGVLNVFSQSLVPYKFKPIPELVAPMVFDPHAKAPLFEKTVSEIFQGNQGVIDFFYELMGYMLLGNPIEQIFPVFHGPTAGNGKNTLTDTVVSMLGPYAATLPTTTILAKNMVSEGATPALARLKGRRLAVVSEPDKKYMMDTGLVKQLTGDRYINVRGNYANNEDLKIEFTLLMLANSLPRMRDDDQGIWRRLRVIPFERQFKESEMVKGLGDQLLKESSGILNLLLEGARRYLLRGELATPPEVTAATKGQRLEVDPLDAFINDKLKKAPGEEAPLKGLFELYQEWKKENPAFQSMTKHEMGRRLEEKGYIKNVRGNLPYFQGLTVETL